MKFMGSLIAVKDMAVSRAFYEGFLGQKVTMDFNANVTFENGFSLQTIEMWADFLQMPLDAVILKNNAAELYFETEDFDAFMAHLNATQNIVRVHDPVQCPWGQRAIRLYDPDNHIIEIGENMDFVVKRFLSSGMSCEAVSELTMYPVDYVKQLQPSNK